MHLLASMLICPSQNDCTPEISPVIWVIIEGCVLSPDPPLMGNHTPWHGPLPPAPPQLGKFPSRVQTHLPPPPVQGSCPPSVSAVYTCLPWWGPHILPTLVQFAWHWKFGHSVMLLLLGSLEAPPPYSQPPAGGLTQWCGGTWL